jgi:hypothetical protein
MAETNGKQVRNGLLVLGRRLERRARRRGAWDALRNVRAPEGEHDGTPSYVWEPCDRYPSSTWGDGGWYPPYILELAESTTSTLELLGAEAHETVGPHNATVRRLAALFSEAELELDRRRREEAETEAAVPPRTDGQAYASDPAAQGRRRLKAATHRTREAEDSVSSVRAQLEEAIALRAAAVAPLRQMALQIHALGKACQHCYWAWRLRFSLRRHGPRPAARHMVVPLPDWVVSDAALFDTDPKNTVAANGGEEVAA